MSCGVPTSRVIHLSNVGRHYEVLVPDVPNVRGGGCSGGRDQGSDGENKCDSGAAVPDQSLEDPRKKPESFAEKCINGRFDIEALLRENRDDSSVAFDHCILADIGETNTCLLESLPCLLGG